MNYWKGLLPALALLAGCSEQLVIDDRYRASGQDNRVQYIVLHYTSSGFERSFNVLTQGDVSSHYLISDHDPVIYRLVDENRRAWHAGDSSWQGRTWLNASSIGIEMVNDGYVDRPDCRQWQAWDQPQIDALIKLLRDIQASILRGSSLGFWCCHRSRLLLLGCSMPVGYNQGASNWVKATSFR